MNEGYITNDNTQLSENVTYTNDTWVACNGGGGSLGHPQVWLKLGDVGHVTCPYCSRRFINLGAGIEN